MGVVVLRDGRILDLTDEQYERLGMAILMSPSARSNIRVGDQTFNMDDIVTDPQERIKIMQTKLLDVPKVAIKSKKVKELA